MDAMRLTERDQQILTEHFGRFRITTVEALHRLYWSDRTVDAAKKWTGRMRVGQYLRCGELANGRRFFYPTHKTAVLAGFSRRFVRPPRGFDLARYYGILSFCCLGATRYEKISTIEFGQRFAALCARQLDQSLYYADTDYTDDRYTPRMRIGYLLVDAGSRVRQILARFHRVISQRLSTPLWHQWIERGRLIVAVVTADPDKQRRLREALTNVRQPVPYRVEVRPDLLDVIPMRIVHASQRQDNP
jgi:hypothetical protein